LQSNTFLGLIVGENIITLQRTNSTNDYLKYQLSNSAPYQEGTVIMAEEQFAGRGQMGSSWKSEPGKNLTFSILLNPSFLSPQQQFELNIAISLGLIQALIPFLGKKVHIKWPNDIYVEDKKLGGILIENIFRGKMWKHAVIGIGLNVNQTTFPDLTKATSLQLSLQQTFDRQQLLKQLCASIDAQYALLKNQKQTEQKKAYLQHLYRIGQPCDFIIGGVRKTGKIINVNPSGQLEVSFEGKTEAFNSKEIEFVI